MNALLLALLLLAPEGAATRPAAEIRPPWVIVLLDGGRIPLRQEPKWVFGRASVRDAAGRLRELHWNQVDHEATRRANPRLESEPDGLPPVWDEEALRGLRGRRLNVVDNGGPAEELAQTARAEEGATLSQGTWRRRATALRERMARLEAELAYLDRARDSWESFALGTGGDYNAAAASELGEIRRAREARASALRSATSEWARLEEEARRSRVPPGWLR